MQKKPIQLPAYLTGFSSRSDGGVGLRFTTNELQPEEIANLSAYMNDFGYLLFRPNPFQPSDIPTEVVEDKDKTPSKRLRAVLFLLHKQRGVKQEFDAWYRQEVEKIIEHIKTKLE